MSALAYCAKRTVAINMITFVEVLWDAVESGDSIADTSSIRFRGNRCVWGLALATGFFQISDFRFQISDFRFQISDFRFSIFDFRFKIQNSKFGSRLGVP